jgi:hypothetical protein
MKRNIKSRKRSKKEQSNQKVFTTVDEFSSHFFPKGRPEKEVIKGKERGAEAAEKAFSEIAKVLQV